jgi:hypothetical protein
MYVQYIVQASRSLHSFLMYDIQHCFICRPSDSTVSEDAGIEPRAVATTALAVRRSNHSTRSHPYSARSHPLSARSHPLSASGHHIQREEHGNTDDPFGKGFTNKTPLLWNKHIYILVHNICNVKTDR